MRIEYTYPLLQTTHLIEVSKPWLSAIAKIMAMAHMDRLIKSKVVVVVVVEGRNMNVHVPETTYQTFALKGRILKEIVHFVLLLL